MAGGIRLATERAKPRCHSVITRRDSRVAVKSVGGSQSPLLRGGSELRNSGEQGCCPWSSEGSLTPVDGTPPPAPPVPQGTGDSTSAVIDGGPRNTSC